MMRGVGFKLSTQRFANAISCFFCYVLIPYPKNFDQILHESSAFVSARAFSFSFLKSPIVQYFEVFKNDMFQKIVWALFFFDLM